LSSEQLMVRTTIALTPGLLAAIYVFGLGILFNVLFAILIAVILEFVLQRLLGHPFSRVATSSGCLAAVLLALCLPPLLPLSYVALGVGFALIFGKYVYGGLGQNLFNPAMVGYAALLLTAPLALSQWLPESGITPDLETLLAIKLQLQPVDGYTGATALDLLRNRGALTIEEYWLTAETVFSDQMLIGSAYLLGGIYLIQAKIINYQLPLAMLLGLLVPSLLAFDGGSSSSLGSPILHFFAGATLLGAFFIITDPVSSPNTPAGIITYGLLIGLLTFLIRGFGAYPDGLAFAVLLANACGPLLDHTARHWQKTRRTI